MGGEWQRGKVGARRARRCSERGSGVLPREDGWRAAQRTPRAVLARRQCVVAGVVVRARCRARVRRCARRRKKR